MTTVRTIKRGDTPDERVVIQADDTEDPTADPVVADIGDSLQGAAFLHIYAELGGSITAATVTPWYFSTIADQWFEGDALVFSATAKFALVETQGEERVFFVVDSITGVGTLKVWAGYSYDSPGRDP